MDRCAIIMYFIKIFFGEGKNISNFIKENLMKEDTKDSLQIGEVSVS